jgi:hypothetical protein
VSAGSWSTSIDEALTPERSFKPGERIVFNPPPGAYSPVSLQRKLAGQSATVRRMANDDYVIADFESRHGVLLNSCFVEREE